MEVDTTAPTPSELEATKSEERVKSLRERLELELEQVELDDAAAVKESCGRADAIKEVWIQTGPMLVALRLYTVSRRVWLAAGAISGQAARSRSRCGESGRAEEALGSIGEHF